MKIFLPTLWITALVFAVGCVSKHRYAINIPKKFEGWVYVLKSTGIKDSLFYSPNTMGIVYVPSTMFEQGSFDILIDGKPADRGISTYEEEDSFATDGKKLRFIKFYYPFTRNKKEQFYYIGSKPVTQFAALFSTPYIDKNRIVLE